MEMLKVLIFKLLDHAVTMLTTLAVFFFFFNFTPPKLPMNDKGEDSLSFHPILKKQLDHLTPTPYHSCLSFTFKNTAAKALFLTK